MCAKTTMDWQQYWREFPRRFDDTDFCRQVGRTAHGGIPTREEELDRVVGQVARGLELGRGDRLLDLCCGNGLLTARMARTCSSAVGVDFSAELLAVARDHHAPSGVSYVEASVLELTPELFAEQPFDKVSMFESLQYFEPSDLPVILRGVRSVSSPSARIYFSGVLDAERIWHFYDTAERRREYEKRRAAGSEIMGHWWRRDEIATVAAEAGLRCEPIAQDPTLNTAHYRFDVLLTPAT